MSGDIQVSYVVGDKFEHASQQELDDFRQNNPEEWSGFTPARREGREPLIQKAVTTDTVSSAPNTTLGSNEGVLTPA